MLDLKHAGYGSAERYQDDATRALRTEALERIVRLMLAICFMGVLGLELWLLISAFAAG